MIHLGAKVVDATAGSSDMENPVPVGFTQESWKEYLLDMVYQGSTVHYGGTDVVFAVVDKPVVWDGPVPQVELVALSADELDGLDAAPGDVDPASTPLHTWVYMLADDGSESVTGAGTPNKEFPDTPEMNPEDNFWTDEVGSSLAFGRDSGISITGSYFAGWPPIPPLMLRQGEACFHGYFTNGEGCAEVLFPVTPFPWPTTRTTKYAQMHTVEVMGITFLVWLVYEPALWVTVGEDGWDEIVIYGDDEADLYPLLLETVKVEHNSKTIVQNGIEAPPWIVMSSSDSRDMTGAIWNYKLSLVHNSANPVVRRAVEDYAQAASFKYPVFPHDDLWVGHEVPNLWCSEFAAWGYRQGAADVSYGGYEPGTVTLPEAEIGDDDIGVEDIKEWAQVANREIRNFGKDEKDHPELLNGPTYEEWAELSTGVKEGDYVARNKEYTMIDRATHSMIIVGWLADDGTDVGSQHFYPERHCNRLLVVDGNIGSAPYPGAHGLGSTVTVSERVVCRPSEDDFGYSVDPIGDDKCVIDGETKECSVRLWDFLPNGNSTGGFFIDMEMY